MALDQSIFRRSELLLGDKAMGRIAEKRVIIFGVGGVGSLKDKALLILMATQTQATFFSSMGAALKLDPTRIKTAEFWKVQGDPLARALRKRFKRDGQYPKRKFLCVYSDELTEPQGEGKGSIVHITAVFGFMLAGLVIQDVLNCHTMYAIV